MAALHRSHFLSACGQKAYLSFFRPDQLARVMVSPSLMELQPEQRDAEGHVTQLARYTTQAQFQVERNMALRADRMAATQAGMLGSAAQRLLTEASLAKHGKLSEEQREAVRHICGPERIAAVVGLAGAGKSTMLSAAQEAWNGDGSMRRVYDGALAGKAAEGLEQSSGLPSRTLACTSCWRGRVCY